MFDAGRINLKIYKQKKLLVVNIIQSWYNNLYNKYLCQDVVVKQFEQRGKMGGKGYIVQIDESLFQGRRKYNRGRLRLGDHRPKNNENSYSDSSFCSNFDNDSDDENQNIENLNRNYGNCVQGLGVFGVCCCLRQNNILEHHCFN